MAIEITRPDGQHVRGQNLNTHIDTQILMNVDAATLDQALVFQENHTPSEVEKAGELTETKVVTS